MIAPEPARQPEPVVSRKEADIEACTRIPASLPAQPVSRLTRPEPSPVPALLDAVTAAYSVRALADPQLVGRLLALFAQQNLVPDRVRAQRIHDRLSVLIEQPEVSEHQASVIAEKMRSMVLVENVSLECHVRAFKRASRPADINSAR